LEYEAAQRDLRAAVETAYYQVLLDEGLIAVNAEKIENLRQALQVTKIKWEASQAAQSDFIAAELNLAQTELQQQQYKTNRLNDDVALTALLYRRPGSPLNLERQIQLKPLDLPLSQAVDMATRMRQEVLETALTEKNATTALKLAQMEYLPNYSVGYEFDYILQSGAEPLPGVTQGHTFSFGFNMPVFFWIHQREDVRSAQHSLEAARYNLRSVLNQTESNVTELYQSARFAYQSAQKYSQSLIPLARQNFKVALIAYETNKVDFLTLSAALQNSYAARVTYLQNTNQFLSGRIALEQAIGAPLPR
jgi:outer membrane protein TolC